MAPFKEERGDARRASRHTLYSMSTQVAGGWINHTLVHEVMYVPEESKAVRTMGQSYGTGRNSRQTQLFPERETFAQEAQDLSDETQEDLCDDEGLELSGYPKPTITPSETQRVFTNSASSRLVESQEPAQLSSSRSSSTLKAQLSQQQTPPLPTSNPPDTDSDESSAKSGSKRLKPSLPQPSQTLATRSSFPLVSSSGKKTSTQAKASPSARRRSTVTRAK